MSLDSPTVGYTSDESTFACLFCDETVRMGPIYPQGSDLVEAELAIKNHIKAAHESTFRGLLALGKKCTGLSDTQRALLGHFHDGLSDKAIQPLAGDVSLSTLCRYLVDYGFLGRTRDGTEYWVE